MPRPLMIASSNTGSKYVRQNASTDASMSWTNENSRIGGPEYMPFLLAVPVLPRPGRGDRGDPRGAALHRRVGAGNRDRRPIGGRREAAAEAKDVVVVVEVTADRLVLEAGAWPRTPPAQRPASRSR